MCFLHRQAYLEQRVKPPRDPIAGFLGWGEGGGGAAAGTNIAQRRRLAFFGETAALAVAPGKGWGWSACQEGRGG